uniref:Uncharacterized protein n=1 Tax=Ciona intestinalis TaxID=7719 RepID=H2XPQ5_CIOIN
MTSSPNFDKNPPTVRMWKTSPADVSKKHFYLQCLVIFKHLY